MSAYDVIECPPDPCEAARERIRDLLTPQPLNDPRPHVPSDDKATRYGWIMAWSCFVAIVICKLTGVI